MAVFLQFIYQRTQVSHLFILMNFDQHIIFLSRSVEYTCKVGTSEEFIASYKIGTVQRHIKMYDTKIEMMINSNWKQMKLFFLWFIALGYVVCFDVFTTTGIIDMSYNFKNYFKIAIPYNVWRFRRERKTGVGGITRQRF